MGEVTLESVHKELELLKKVVEDIRKNMADSDCILTAEENKELDESIERYNKGETKSLEEIEKTLE